MVRLSDLLDTFANTYAAIDIRTATVRHEEDWINSVTVIRLTYETRLDVKNRFNAIQKSFGEIRTNDFGIWLDCREISEWEELCNEFRGGRFQVEGLAVNLARSPIDLANSTGRLTIHHGQLRESNHWPSVETSWHQRSGSESIPYGKAPAELPSAEFICRQVELLGFTSPYEAMASVMELNIESNRPPEFDVYLAVPVFAKVSDLKYVPGVPELAVTVSHHRKFPSFSCNIVSKAGRSLTSRLPVPDFADHGDGVIVASEARVHRDISQDEHVEVALAATGTGEIHRAIYKVEDLLPAGHSTPLLAALSHFCSVQNFATMLLHPHAQKAKQTKPQGQFEQHVGWLLSCSGYSSVILGEFERLAHPETQVEIASVDSLAFDQAARQMLVVGCTIKAPKEEDLSNLLRARTELAESISDQVDELVALIFTGMRGYPGYRVLGGEGDRFLTAKDIVVVCDADSMASLVRKIAAGTKGAVQDYIQDQFQLATSGAFRL